MGILNPQFGSIVPSQAQQTLSNNYLTFDGAAGGNFAQQYLPELYEAEVERYGNRTLSLHMTVVQMVELRIQLLFQLPQTLTTLYLLNKLS